VDFISAISKFSIISKGSTLFHVIVEADCVGRQHLMVDMAPRVLANQEDCWVVLGEAICMYWSTLCS